MWTVSVQTFATRIKNKICNFSGLFEKNLGPALLRQVIVYQDDFHMPVADR